MKKEKIIILLLGICLLIPNTSFAEVEINEEIGVITERIVKDDLKYPNYAETYLGEDKYENFNRKIFDMNLKMNKYFLKPIHIVWASIIPQYGMDRIQSVYSNIQYPKRLVSSLIQKDFKTSGNETIRFLTNSTIGLGGMFDAADRFFNISQRDEGMEEALAKCNIKQGSYLVMPCVNSTTPRGMFGSLLDNLLNPSNYIGTPVVGFVKMGFTINRTYYMQPMLKMIESTYADPYDIAKKMYGLERYIKTMDIDRKNILGTTAELAFSHENSDPMNMNRGMESNFPNTPQENVSFPPNNYSLPSTPMNNPNNQNLITPNYRPGNTDDITDPPKDKNRRGDGLSKNYDSTHLVNKFDTYKLKADINLDKYSPQNPITDAMRTALFEQVAGNKSIWSEFSVWNRSFSKKIKDSYIVVDSNKEKYKFKYILQKDKSAPVVIIYPSIGESVNSHHSIVLAKLFYDEGYSAIIQGSHFQWEFVKSMPDGYIPGNPSHDINYVRLVTQKIVNAIEDKNDCKLGNKTIIGTSFGAMMSLFLAEKESQENTLNIEKYISINPPIELLYALKQIDNATAVWKNSDDLKQKVALSAAKVIKMYELKNNNQNIKLDILPFSEEEAKLITGFVLHQKLSDLVFTLENTSKTQKTDIYEVINRMNYEDYAKKYLMQDRDNNLLAKETSLYFISDYLQNNDNYKIYHTLDDYLVSTNQLSKLKTLAQDNLILLNNGSHLGFLYRDEFLNELKAQINLRRNIIASKR